MWQREQTQKCPDCGTYDWEWEEDPEAWEADLHWCIGCLYLERLADDTRKVNDPRGYKLRLYKGRHDAD